jgi:hypothetical protein
MGMSRDILWRMVAEKSAVQLSLREIQVTGNSPKTMIVQSIRIVGPHWKLQ